LNDVGTDTEKLWPPSPLAVKLAAVEAGEGIFVGPPDVVTTPVVAIETVPLPVLGRMIRPNASGVELVSESERKTLAVAAPDPVPVPRMVIVEAVIEKFAVEMPLLTPASSARSGKSKPTQKFALVPAEIFGSVKLILLPVPGAVLMVVLPALTVKFWSALARLVGVPVCAMLTVTSRSHNAGTKVLVQEIVTSDRALPAVNRTALPETLVTVPLDGAVRKVDVPVDADATLPRSVVVTDVIVYCWACAGGSTAIVSNRVSARAARDFHAIIVCLSDRK
jgi:hypothetical protein